MRLLLLALLTFLCTSVRAQNDTEEITHFSVDIQTLQDASLRVTETITVVANGDQVRRGITRALHRKPLGTDETLAPFTYDVTSVTRDGADEPYHLKINNGLPTIYIGKKDVYLDPGTYTYVVKYLAKNQVYPVGVTDEIRWPLEGSSGSLPVRDADITIRFARDIKILQSACYTGSFGSTAEDCEFSQDGDIVTFVATRPLKPGEGMTVAASISQGYFARPVPPPPPTPFEQNAVLFLVVAGLVVGSGYAYSMWQKYGVDPKGPPVKNEYYAPEEFSPAVLGYLSRGYPSHETVTASLTALSIAGYLEIREEKEKAFLKDKEIFIVSLTDQQPAADELPVEQAVLYNGIAAEGGLKLDGKYNKAIETLTNDHQKAMETEHKSFIKDGLSFKGLLPLAAILVVSFGLAVYYLAQTGIGKLAFAIGLFLAILLFGLYGYLIQQPSLGKVTMLGKIKGFRQYLSLSEKKRKALPNAPEMTPPYFQQILPYAIALGIDNNWAADLASDWAATGQQQQSTNHLVAAPFLMAGFGKRLGSSYSQTSVNPASSAGGGGFSGGGGSVGGGGGTGGW